jgi:hypothetical protein
MGPRRFLWSLSLPLAAVAWFTAHSLAYVLVEPRAEHRDEHLAETGHTQLIDVPVVAACALTLVLAGFALAVHDGVRDRARGRLPLWPLALLPPVGFAVQEHLERLIASNAFPIDAALEPTFALGLALQLPFAAMGVLVARFVLGFGYALGRRATLRNAVQLPVWETAANIPARPDPVLARRPVLASSHGQRAPPRSAFV